ncbi:MAG: carbohydrate-binding domain-containing protein, partial [Muribaculaceae bacterium]|nr:carbohydrate-binding domain-containing protein [Muribaculaceae bacterium]
GTKGGLATAALDGVTRTALGADLDSAAAPETTLYLDNGQNSGVIIDEVELLSDGRISFRVTLPDDPTPITPGRYDVDGDDYFISQSGAYIFYGSTTHHHITVATGVKDVDITFEAVDMDLSAQSRSLSPLTIRSGAEVTISLASAGDQTVTLLSGAVYMPGIQVERGGRATIQGAGGTLNASGGTGAPGVGSDAFSSGGSLHLKDLRATITGGGGYQINSGGTILVLCEGSAALGGGYHQTMDGITLENVTLEALGGNSVQAIATGYLDISAGKYIPGGDLTIRNSAITAQGSIDAGERLTVENTTLAVTVGEDSLYNGALNATKKITLTSCATSITATKTNTGMNRNTPDSCEVEVRGGSLRVHSYLSCVTGRRIAISGDTDLVLTSENEMPLTGPWADDGTATTGGIVTPAGEAPGVFLQGGFTARTAYRGTYSLVDAESGAGRYAELPANTRTFVVSLPRTGSYTLKDEDAAASGPLNVALQGLNTINDITLQAPSRLERRVDLSQDAHLTQSGTYVLAGAGNACVTVDSGLNVTIYLDNVTLDAAHGAALTIGANTTASIIAKRGTENTLFGGVGYPAVIGDTGSVLAFSGTGTVAAVSGAGAAAIDGKGKVTIEQVTPLVAVSDQNSALVRGQNDSASWSALVGAEPIVARITLAEALSGNGLLTLFADGGSRQVAVRGGEKSLFITLKSLGSVTLERWDGAATDPLECVQKTSEFVRIGFKTVTMGTISVLDLSEKSHVVSKNGQYRVTGTTSTNTLRVAAGVSAHLIFDNVSVTQFCAAPYIVDLGAGSVTTIELAEGTQNRLEGYPVPQAPEAAAIHVPATARLTITGQGSLVVSGCANVTTVGAGKDEEGGTISIAGGSITFRAPSGSGNSRWGLGGRGSSVDISGGVVTQAADYGMGLGGANARVTIRGGQVNWRTAGSMPIGGAQSTVTIAGGQVTVDLARGGVGIGGAGSRVTVQGGTVALNEPDSGNGASVSAAMGGADSRLTLTGGSITGVLRQPTYKNYGGFGGTDAAATVGNGVSIFLRYRHKDAEPVVNTALFSGAQAQAAFLDIRLRNTLTNAETLTLRRTGDNKTVSVPLKSGDAGFFLLLEEGVWELENASGGYGGAYSLTPGVTTQKDVTFDRLRGVFLESKTVTYSGGTHTLTVSGLPTGATVTYKNNSQKEPGVYDVTATITTPAKATYDLNATLTITKARLTVTGVAANDKVYNGNTAATGRLTFTGAVGSERPSLTATFRCRDANAGSGKTVTVTNVQLSSATEAARYDVDDVDPALLTTTASITPKPVTFTIPASALRQMAGIVAPVEPSYKESGLPEKDVVVTYTSQSGAATQTVP